MIYERLTYGKVMRDYRYGSTVPVNLPFLDSKTFPTKLRQLFAPSSLRRTYVFTFVFLNARNMRCRFDIDYSERYDLKREKNFCWKWLVQNNQWEFLIAHWNNGGIINIATIISFISVFDTFVMCCSIEFTYVCHIVKIINVYHSKKNSMKF